MSRRADINKDLFLYLPMGEGSGNVKDYGPNNFRTKMSKKNAPKWVSGKKDTSRKGCNSMATPTLLKLMLPFKVMTLILTWTNLNE